MKIKNKQLVMLAQIILILFYVLILIFNIENVEVLKKLCLINLVIALLTGLIFFKNKINIYTIFILTLFLFNYSRVFLDVLEFKVFSNVDWFAKYQLSLITQMFILNILVENIMFLNLGVIVGFFLLKKDKKEASSYLNLEKISFYLGVILTPLVLYKNIEELNYIKSVGYLAIYTGGLQELNFPFIIRISTTLFAFNYYVFLVSKPRYRYFQMMTIIFLLCSFIDALKGGRLAFIVRSLIVLWYYSNIYMRKLKVITLFFIGNVLLIFSYIIENIRLNNIVEKTSILDKLCNFLYNQGVSMTLIGFIKDFAKQIPEKNYLFAPIFDIYSQLKYPNLYKGNQTKELIEVTSDFSHNISFYLNQENYLNGMGLGSNYIAELYIFSGKYLFFIVCIFLGIFIVILEKKALKYRISFLYFICFLQSFFVAGRGSLFFSSLYFLKLLLYYALVLLTIKFIVSFKKLKKEVKI